MTDYCPYCETPNDEGIGRDDCCHGAEAAALRRENNQLREELAMARACTLAHAARELRQRWEPGPWSGNYNTVNSAAQFVSDLT